MKTYTQKEVAKFNAISVALIMQLLQKDFTLTDTYNYFLAVTEDIGRGSIEKACKAFDEMMLQNNN